MSRLLVFMATVAGLSLGCSSEYRVDGGPLPDGSAPMGVIELESEPSLTLTFGAEAELVVRYTESGVAVQGAPIRFALEGRAHDSTVADLSVDTDAEGRARTRMVAGSTASAFRVRVSAERAAPIYVNVSVGNMGFGALVVRAEYDGLRAGGRRVIELYSSMSCADEPPPFPDRMAALDPSTTEARFRALPAGLTYAVLARVEGPGGLVVARACADGVEVVRDDETVVELPFADAPLAPAGRYEAVLALTPTSSSAWASEVATDAGGALIDTAGGGAELYLDALEAELRERGATVGADALALERASGVPVATLSAALEEDGADPRVALEAALAGLRTRMTALALSGPLSIDVAAGSPSATWAAAQLAVGPSDPDSPALVIDPGAAGLELSPSLSISWPAGDALVLESLTLTLPLGTLARRTLEAELAARSLGSPGELLAARAGCDALAAWIADDPIAGPLCTADCPRAACLRALDGIMEASLEALDLLDEARGALTVSGTIEMIDADADLLVDQLAASELSGTWSGATESDPVAGGLTAARSPE